LDIQALGIRGGRVGFVGGRVGFVGEGLFRV